MKKYLEGNVLYAQGGGPTSVINATAYGLIKEASKHSEIKKIYYAKYGLLGILNDYINEIIFNENLKKLINTPGAYFGSSRIKLNVNSDEDKFNKILDVFKKYDIKYFFYNGGNDSMDTINKISKFLDSKNYECYCLGINKTIDNDLFGTDFSLGYPSAATFIANSVIQIALDDLSYKEGRVNIVEVMGRDSGWLAASSKIAKLKNLEPNLIYVPENPFDLEDFLKKVKNIYDEKKHCLVVVSEGIEAENHLPIFSENIDQKDKFGHVQLGGVSIKLAHLVTSKLGIKTRYFELSLLQRASTIKLNKFDYKMAIKCGESALKSALKQCSNKVITIKRISSKPYKYKLDLVYSDEIANKVRKLPNEYIDKENSTIKDEFLDYILPLIEDDKYLIDIYKN